MDRPDRAPRTPRRLLLATLVAALAVPALSAVALPPGDALGPSPTSTSPPTPVDVPTTEEAVDVREDLDLEALPFLDAAGEYDLAGDAALTEDPLTPELVVMGEDPGHGSHDHEARDHEGDTPGSAGQQADADAGPDTAASAASGSLPGTRRPLVCEPNGGFRTVVVYAHLRGEPAARSSHLGTIRATVERSNQMLAQSSRASGGPLADLRTRCTSGGSLSVASAEVTSRDFGDIKRQLAQQGFANRHEKYLIFADFTHGSRNIAGLADLFHDTRRSLHNHNNGNHAMYSVVYGSRHFTGTTAIHELTHMMGAAQRGAPRADSGGHCTYSGDLLCRGSASSTVLDRGNDTYFSTGTRPGQWLHHHWNLGWEGNRFVRVQGRPAPNLPPTAAFDVDCARATCTFDASGSRDPDGTIARYRFTTSDGGRMSSRVSRHRFPDNGTYEVTLTVTDDRGATATTTRSVRVRGATAPTAQATVTCDGMTCTLDASRSNDRDGGSIEGYRWTLEDGRTSTRRVWTVTFDEPGRTPVTLAVTDDDGWTGTTTATAWPRSGDVAADTGLGDTLDELNDLVPEVEPALPRLPETEVGLDARVGDLGVDVELRGLTPKAGFDLGGGRTGPLG